MRNLRDLVLSLRAREGVRAAVLVGRDGLVIEGETEPSVSPDEVAAHVPSIMAAAQEIGRAGDSGVPQSAVLLHDRGVCIISQVSADVHLAVILQRDARFGDLLQGPA